MHESPSVLRSFQNDKVYINNESVWIDEISTDFFIILKDSIVSTSFLFRDEKGFYIPVSLERVGNKLFKLHCNDCGYEWEGGVFDFQCKNPKCKSTNIVSLPNN